MTPTLVFDLDGTLIDSAPDIHAAGNAVLQAEGLPPVSFEQARSFIGHGAGIFVERLIAAQGLPPDPARRDRMLARFIAHYEGAVGSTALYPNVLPVLATLAARGWRMGICTNKPLSPTRTVLRHFGLDHFFAHVIGGDSLPTRKPDPAPLRASLAGLGTDRAIYIGDSEVDAETAHACALPFVLFTPGYRKSPPESLNPAACFDHYDALPDIVARLWD